MTQEQERSLFEQYSRGGLTRHDLGRQLGRDLSFGDTLTKLHELKLPLPRPRYDPDSPGSQALRSLLRQNRHG